MAIENVNRIFGELFKDYRSNLNDKDLLELAIKIDNNENLCAAIKSLQINISVGKESQVSETKEIEKLPETEIAKIEEPKTDIELYKNISQVDISKEESHALIKKIDPRIIEIRPDGIAYLPGVWFRKILISAFGAGKWSLHPRKDGIKIDKQERTVYWHGALYVKGAYVSEAVGQHQYYSGSTGSYGNSVESAKTDCLTRCCKDLGIGSELWDPQYVRNWMRDYTEKINVLKTLKNGKKEIVQIWVRIFQTVLPYPYEFIEPEIKIDFEKYPIPDTIDKWFDSHKFNEDKKNRACAKYSHFGIPNYLAIEQGQKELDAKKERIKNESKKT